MARAENSSDFRDIVETAKSQKWVVDQTTKGHWRFKPPTGQIVIFSGSPGDHRAILNMTAALRRNGLRYRRHQH